MEETELVGCKPQATFGKPLEETKASLATWTDKLKAPAKKKKKPGKNELSGLGIIKEEGNFIVTFL